MPPETAAATAAVVAAAGSTHLLAEPGRVRREILTLAPQAPFSVRELSAPELAYPLHEHPEIELVHIRAGRGLRYVGDSITRFEGGDLVLVGGGTPHTWSSEHSLHRAFEFVVIQFGDAVFGADFLRLPAARPLVDLFARARRGVRFWGGARQHAVAQIADLRAPGVSPLGQLARLLALLEGLAATAEAETIAESAAHDLISSAGARARRVLAHIEAHAGGPLPERELARIAGLSPSAFSRFFHRCFGKTFVQHVMEVRVARACRLLIEQELSVTAVAFESGFRNISNFNRRFLRARGVTPSEYRRLARRAG